MASFKEVLRRLYHDVVRRRATVRVVPAGDAAPLEAPPVFLVGPYRSGTTLLRYVFDSHPAICCPPESDFIAPLRRLVEVEAVTRGFDAMGFDEEHVVRRTREFVLYFFANYAASHGKSRWADKTPAYVDHLDWLLRLFPEARFVTIYRHGLDQAHSFTRGGTFVRPQLEGYGRPGEDLRLGAVRYWVEKVERMRAFEQAHPGRCEAVRYEDLCARPETELRRLFASCGLEWDPAVLRFFDFDHDKGNEDGRAAVTRGFEARTGHFASWSPALREAALEIARPGLLALGYPADGRVPEDSPVGAGR